MTNDKSLQYGLIYRRTFIVSPVFGAQRAHIILSTEIEKAVREIFGQDASRVPLDVSTRVEISVTINPARHLDKAESQDEP